MKIHEYQAMELLRRYDIPQPHGSVAETPEQAYDVARSNPYPLYVVKAQVHAGGRGKAGGVKLARTPEEVRDIAASMIGHKLITKQTGEAGKIINRVLVKEGVDIGREMYFSMTLDNARAMVCIMACADGGTEIEETAARAPEKIIRSYIDPLAGVRGFQIQNIASALGLDGAQTKELRSLTEKLYRLYIECDCSLLEVNPLITDEAGHLLVLDIKMDFDSNALFRHPDIAAMRDISEEEPRETKASEYDLNYIQLDGNIGCMVNGAGLAMATMDAISYYGGKPANFLDVGGGATKERIAGAFRIITSDPNVKGIFINIFGGIMRCDILAEGIAEAAAETSLSIPLVVRMQGTNCVEGMQILAKSGLDIISEGDLTRATKRICSLVSNKKRSGGARA